jgi:hypothetical protein
LEIVGLSTKIQNSPDYRTLRQRMGECKRGRREENEERKEKGLKDIFYLELSLQIRRKQKSGLL